MKRLLQIRPVDPILSRDGRPFGDSPGAFAHSLSDIPPSVVAGTIRTLIGKRLSAVGASNDRMHFSKDDFSKAIAKIFVRGPLPVYKDRVYFPFPQDIEFVPDATGSTGLRLRAKLPQPLNESAGEGFLGTDRDDRYSDLLWPARSTPGKAVLRLPAYLSAEAMTEWLSRSYAECDWETSLADWYRTNEPDSKEGERREQSRWPDSLVPFLPELPREVRTHVAIDYATGVSSEGKLFDTEALAFPSDFTLVAEADLSNSELHWLDRLSELHSIGGKRRIAHFSEPQDPRAFQSVWTCPKEIAEAVDGAGYIRMCLATPAYFSKGWRPGWLDAELCGSPDSLFAAEDLQTNVRLQLVWACIPGWQPVSGWSYRRSQEKAVRRMVPAGSVFFFKVLDGNPRELAERLWLRSVSDRNRRTAMLDRDDGFGLALWGVWKR